MVDFEGRTDLQSVCDLINACALANGLEADEMVEGLRARLDNAGLGAGLSARLWKDDVGLPAGYAELSTISKREKEELYLALGFHIRPNARHDGLDAQILEWADTEARALGERQQKVAIVVTSVRPGTEAFRAARSAALSAAGFVVASEIYRLSRPL